MQRSPNMAVLTGYNGTQYLYFVRSLAGEDRERLGMPRQGWQQVVAGSPRLLRAPARAPQF